MKKLFGILLIITLLISFIPIPTKAETLKQYKELLEKEKAKYAANQASINKTQAEINSTNKEIENIKKEMISMAAEIGQLQEDVTSYKEEIEKKELQTKKLIEYLQLSGGENLYLEYAFGAESITDLIYRMSVVEQLTDYNDDVIKELKVLIEKCEEREKEINKKEKELNVKQSELGELVESLGEDKEALSESGVSVSKQIKFYEDTIKQYEKEGCKDNDVIGVDCATTVSSGTWRLPTTSGYVTSEFKYRSGSLHRAVDIGNKKPYQTKIYAVAAGKITRIYYDYYGARVVLIEHYDAKTKTYYTSNYCHMSSYNPKIYVGMKVTSNTWIGYMGMSGKATGPHLHLEIFPCRLYNLADKNCSTWNKYVAYASKLYNQGYEGPRKLINFPKGTYNSWSTR